MLKNLLIALLLGVITAAVAELPTVLQPVLAQVNALASIIIQ